MKKSSSAFVAGVLVAALMVISMMVFAAAQAPNSGNSTASQGATTRANTAAAPEASPNPNADATKQAGSKDGGASVDVTPYYNLYLQKLAADLGVSQDKLNSSMTQALHDTLAQAVADGKLTQQQADESASEWANMQVKFFASLFMSGGSDSSDKLGGVTDQVTQQMYQAAAARLGMTTDQLKQALGSQTLAQIAASKGVTEQALKDAVINAIKPTLDQAVKDGKMTQAQEDDFIQSIRNADLNKALGDVGGDNPQDAAMKTISRQANDAAMQAAAGKLGMSVDQLWSDVDGSIGRSLGDVAAEKNVSATDIKTAVVNAVKPILDQALQGNTIAQADESSIIQGIQNDDFSKPFDQFGFDDSNSALARQVLAQVFKATESKLNITAAQLNDQLQQGKSLADMAQSANVSVADLKTAIISGVQSALNQAVAGGKVTQDFANRAIQSIQNADLSQNPKTMLAGISAPPNKQVKP